MRILHRRKASSNQRNRWCVYSHYDKNGQVEPYVLEALKRLRRTGFNIVFVSTSPSINEASLALLNKQVAVTALRDNIGYDFGSYKLGIKYLFQEGINPTQLLITNDSVFGPLLDIEHIITKSLKYDLMGMTDSVQPFYHLQSYFIIYNKKVIKSQAFIDFWDSVKLLDPKEKDFKSKIINKYEVDGSQYFMRKGFKIGAAFSFKSIINYIIKSFTLEITKCTTTPGIKLKTFHYGDNPSHQYWKELLHMGFPYIKRELLTVNPTNTDIGDWPLVIQHITKFNPKLIIEALKNQLGNDDFFFTYQPHNLIAKGLKSDGTVTLKMNPALVKWKPIFNTPNSRRFKFDEEYYLFTSLDVKAAYDRGDVKSGLDHFIKHGYGEGRRIKLTSDFKN